MNKIKHLVLSGGGVKGIAILGSLSVLEEENLIMDNVETVIGTSIGALIGMLLCVGYKSKELFEIVLNINDIDRFKNITPIKILTHFGLDSGKKIVEFLEELVEKKMQNAHMTFKELYEKTGKKLILVTTCVNTHSVEYFGPDTTPNIEICSGVRCSIGVPFLLTSVKYKEKYYVDGGLLDNFAFHLVDGKEDILGIRLIGNDHNPEINDIDMNLETFIHNLVSCVLNEVQHLRLKNCKNLQNVLYIDTKDISSLHFNIDETGKKKLYSLGHYITKEYIKNYDKDK